METHLSHERAAQPVVLVLVGDCNLTATEASTGISVLPPEDPEWTTMWHVHATRFGVSGDLTFVKGANPKPFDLPVGCNWPNTGARKDCHNAVGVEL